MNIMLGLTDYGRMKYMLDMAHHYKKMNLCVIQKEKHPDDATKYDH